MKTCATCQELLPPETFHKKSDAKDGLHPHCKPCRSIKEATRYAAIKEVRQVEMREYYRANRSKWPNYVRKWNKAHRHHMAANTAAYRARKIKATIKEDPAINYVYYAADVINSVYGGRPDVDHIVPLRHDKVCGLHASQNLQLLSHSANCAKRNIWLP